MLRIALALFVLTACAASVFGQQSIPALTPSGSGAPQRHNPDPGRTPADDQKGAITNADVIRMVKAGVPDPAIIASIEAGPVRFDLSPDALVALHRAGVGPRVLDAMMATGSTTPNPTPANAGSPTSTPGNNNPPNSKSGQIVRLNLAPASTAFLPPAIAKQLEEQSAQTHSDRSGGSGGTAALSGSGGSSTPGSTSSGSRPLLMASRAGQTQTGSNQTQSSPGMVGPASAIGKIAHASQPVSACRFSSQPTIENVSGKVKGIVFTPDPGSGQYPHNQYSIHGCNFGAVRGKGEVHVYGPFVNHGRTIGLNVDFWSDNLIVATFGPNFVDEYDLENITLVVVAANGQEVQLPNNTFLATRESRLLTSIPESRVHATMPVGKESGFSVHSTSRVLSPVTIANAEKTKILYDFQVTKGTQHHWTAYLDQYVALKDYPTQRYSWDVTINLSRVLHSGFVPSPDFQFETVAETTLGDWGSCVFSTISVQPQLDHDIYRLTVSPDVCGGAGDKWAHAGYGVVISVVGPKGNKLDPFTIAN